MKREMTYEEKRAVLEEAGWRRLEFIATGTFPVLWTHLKVTGIHTTYHAVGIHAANYEGMGPDPLFMQQAQHIEINGD